MKKPLFLVLVMVSLLYTAKAWSLPDCPWYYFSFTYFYNNCQASVTYDDGRKYVGEWRGGKRHGQGTVIWADGGEYAKYVGEWRNGQPNGQGTLTKADGGKYVGEWIVVEGSGQGEGTYTSASGEKHVGIWDIFSPL
jgi:hypothetical protein